MNLAYINAINSGASSAPKTGIRRSIYDHLFSFRRVVCDVLRKSDFDETTTELNIKTEGAKNGH